MKVQRDSVIDYRELRAQKARLGLFNEDLAEQTGASNDTLSRVFNGKENVTLGSVIKIATALGLRRRVTSSVGAAVRVAARPARVRASLTGQCNASAIINTFSRPKRNIFWESPRATRMMSLI